MAKRQQQQQPQQTSERQQLLLSFSTACIMAVLLLARLDCGGVDALSISLNGNGNRLQQQQQEQQQPGNEPLQTQHQLQHVQDNGDEDNYVMHKSTTEVVPNSALMLEDEDEMALKDNGINENLSRSQLSYGHPFKTLNMIKRAPGGFVGMRGKKNAYNDDMDNVDENVDELDDDSYESLAFPWQQLQDSQDDLINWDDYAKPNGRRYKKAPTAFYGVRGKKYSLGNGVNPSGDAYRWQQFLEKLDEDRMRDMIMDDFMDSLVGDHGDVQGEIAKRAPTGFTGVRGKRPSLSVAGGDSSMESVGKRGLGNTFVGVRGKKDVSHQTFKRSPLGGSESAAGGAGGKRQRFHDFGNKFVAVRGKKNSYDLLDDGQMAANDWANMYKNNKMRWSPGFSSSSYQAPGRSEGAGAAMRLVYANTGKRAPSGFMGMRGKRPFTSDDMLTIN